MVFLIEGVSFFTNLLEPHGLTISIKGILKVAGDKHNLKGLENVIEKKEDNDTVSKKDSEA